MAFGRSAERACSCIFICYFTAMYGPGDKVAGGIRLPDYYWDISYSPSLGGLELSWLHLPAAIEAI